MGVIRKSIIALFVVLLAAANLPVANAQNFTVGIVTCSVTSVVPLVRSEGIAELTGDIRASCINTPGEPGTVFVGSTHIVTNFSVALNTNITNTRGFGGNTGLGPLPANNDITDAVLVIDENNSSTPRASSDLNDPLVLDPDIPAPQYGALVSDTRLEWNGVQVPQPGACRNGVAGPCAVEPQDFFPPVTVLRWTNIRANVSQLGVAGVDIFPTTQVIASLSITSNTSISFNQNTVPVGAPIRGLKFSLRDSGGDSLGSPIVGLQCVGVDEEDEGDENEFLVRLEEGFATAFKTIGVPTFQVLSQTRPFEAGYCSPGSGKAPPGGPLPAGGICLDGGATQGTRFILRFFNIPDGASVSVPSCVGSLNGATGSLRLDYIDANSSGAGGGAEFEACPAFPDVVTLDISGGFSYAVYEVTDNNPSINERADVRVRVSYVPDTANDKPAIGTMQVSADFAPLSTRGTSQTKSSLHLIPRFIETNAPISAFSIIKCNTTLLFPFVTNQAGFDTGLAISNTSKDWLSTDPQNGTCTIHYHGETTGGGAAPQEQTSIVINGGEQLIFTLSGGSIDQGIAGAPDFQGYIIAVCEFQFGHGYAFITDGFGGIPNLAQGYLALIIETSAGKRQGLGRDGSEILGH